MLQKTLWLLLALIIGYAAPLTAGSFNLRRSIENKNVIKKPAEIQITLPSKGADSYAVNAGVSYTWESNALTGGFIGEHHQNNQIDSLQNTSLVGLVGAFQKGHAADGNSFFWFLEGKAAYKRNETTSKEGAQGSLVWLPVSRMLGSITKMGGDYLKLESQPVLGVEYENVSKAKVGAPWGNVLRTNGNLDLVFYPLAKALKSRVALGVSYLTWFDFVESSGFSGGKDFHDLLRTSITWYSSDDQDFGISGSYSNGENPSEDLADQKFYQFSVVVRF